jgi:hypothetical protein
VRAAIDVRFTFKDNVGVYNHGDHQSFAANHERFVGPAGTTHKPGIQIDDVQELLEHGSKVVVLSRGMGECLHVPRETLDFLKERQIAVHVLPTQHAVSLYNKLAETESVGGLFHTTC